MNIGTAAAGEVDQIWPACAALLQRAIDKTGDDLTTGELWQMCRSGNAFLVIAWDERGMAMASVWQFQKWANGPVLRCLGLGGERLRAWCGPLNEHIREMMRHGGADRLVFEGRDGWGEFLSRTLKADARRLRATYEVKINELL